MPFSMVEIVRWNVSMTSTNSASEFAEVFRFFGFRGLWLVLSSDTVGDMLVDLLCASASIEPLRQDLLRQADFALLVSSTSARSPHVCGVWLPPASPLPF